MIEDSFYAKVYGIVNKVPEKKVTSYGRVALLLGKPRAARAVGYALNALKKDNSQEIPWQRVINSKGYISFKGDTFRANLQRKLLEKEGIVFHSDGRIDFKIFGWP